MIVYNLFFINKIKIEIKEEEHPQVRLLPWTQLYLSIANGLTCTFLPEQYSGVAAEVDDEPHRLLVKQSYIVKCNEKSTEHFKNFNPHVLKEKSRTIKSDGTVIKYMNDNTIEVKYIFLYMVANNRINFIVKIDISCRWNYLSQKI